MRVPLSWLKEFLPISLSPEEIAHQLTMLGLEVEAIEATPITFQNVVVAEVLAVTEHSNADHLKIATVTDGQKQYQVVCGDPKCEAGMKTALALEGAVLEDAEGQPYKIKATKVRGVDSFGMLCSLKELKLGNADEGIVKLTPEIANGTDLAALYGDVIFEIGLTPNLNYCASIAGVARELAAVVDHKFCLPSISVKENGSKKVETKVKVLIEDPENCPRYTCRVIENVKVGPSPFWLQKRLEQCGLRSINNIVDITNYVLLEFGHPLHAFDLNALEKESGIAQVIIREAKEGECLITLDGKQRHLTTHQLVIADAEKPVALAGIMGGANSEVSDKTVNILLESAYFKPSSIRKTSKAHGLQTDASKRFERGTDPNQLIFALERAAELIQRYASGEVAVGIIDISSQIFQEKVIKCRVNRIYQILGVHLSLSEIENVFQRLGYSYEWISENGQEAISVKVPTYRVDVHGEIDLIEEVARIFGYENLSSQSVSVKGCSTLPHTSIFLFERLVRCRLIAEGLQEALTCDLISPSQMALLEGASIKPETTIKILNPTSSEQSLLRPSLLPGLLQVIQHNLAHQNSNFLGFEIGRIHFKEGEQFKEQSTVGIILTGRSAPNYWGVKPQEVDFYDLKGILENVFQEIGLSQFEFIPSQMSLLHTGRQAAIQIDSQIIGYLGEIHPSLLRRLDISQRVYYAEFNLHALLQFEKKTQRMQPLPIYPGSERDWTLTLKEETPIAEVFQVIRSVPSTLLNDVSLLDLYRSERIGHERKNATFHFVYRDFHKTLSQEEVDQEHARITENALNLLGKYAI